ncbi:MULTISPECIES: diaminobutyrate--2-oxoglutarate transaminase [Moorena]|uniref:Diaminobutyrate--2-oxoglutarate transaminase n=1 Tax=Moorena producens 3L TaxID=489825 RepID=F4XZ18_9CYAN|nr:MULTISPECIES: diaminobutyrate--2-oxoglutarate transaminase [Moorena]EGJ30170.1 diaminobutyrate aminotransferase apoenzyme [Moorena producens 3L]NEP33340.1 diaminobutyrate--2-oxoglutarate transaminase [Moorena sp. SIO3B2]NEP69614.1 diaminobutyrate--2-oxoglutarate transaminase [Moorena sp. SIO3A5]NEQ06147.1 diaminobutyrate--2-oxoglutarate transaminase [Moorena sp. SIO4E2]NER89468.1 diaminobutyrate--2-oxoglutarate transaminase [Moorena sp. SIO3A2]
MNSQKAIQDPERKSILTDYLSPDHPIDEIFNRYESNVRSYCRSFPAVFSRSKGSKLYLESGEELIDFFAGAGTLNYGHNNPFIKDKISQYISQDGLIHGLDMYSSAKKEFLHKFSNILNVRELDYKIQFPGPTGTNAIEAALKLARKVTGREGIFSFMGGFHGVSLGSLAVTGNQKFRKAAGLPLTNVTFIPYESSPYGNFDSLGYIDRILTDPSSGIELPAAIIVETVQAEGGVYVASIDWLESLKSLCERHDILLICDDIQAGCGRTGYFFSFERANITPDIVTLSKSLSGYGLPLSVVLMRRDIDIWEPGEHNGTFRGNQLAFVGASAAFDHYWGGKSLEIKLREKESFLSNFMQSEILEKFEGVEVRGAGMIWGIDMSSHSSPEVSKRVSQLCFENGLVVEVCGRNSSVIKLLPPLTIDIHDLRQGCEIIVKAMSRLW